MKKSLIALAVASAAMAGSAYAANVEVYGLIDTSLAYVWSDADKSGVDSDGKFTMNTGREFGSRVGLRGSEDLGDGLKLGFVLETGFESDTGKLEQGDRIFGREAHINLTGDFGYVAFGRQPIFGSVLGANGLFRAIDPLFANYTEAFGSGYATASMWTRVDNAISYRTPTWGGFTGYAMYSFQNDAKTTYRDADAREGTAEVDRYASLAARYQAGSFESVLVWDMTTYGNERSTKPTDKHGDNIDHGMTATFGGNYTFGNGLKILAFGQWFKEQELNGAQRGGVIKGALTEHGLNGTYGFVDGYGLSLGVNYPIGGGVAKAQVAYRDMENQNDVEFDRWTVAAAYDYPLSKRTSVYAMTGYTQESMESADGSVDADPKGYEFVAGLLHRF